MEKSRKIEWDRSACEISKGHAGKPRVASRDLDHALSLPGNLYYKEISERSLCGPYIFPSIQLFLVPHLHLDCPFATVSIVPCLRRSPSRGRLAFFDRLQPQGEV